jgi:glycosyltransferase involved in cell wall biosynthesis
MRIGIGAILGVLGGPATYARELVRGLVRVDSQNEYVIITDAPGALAVSAPNLRSVRAPLGSSMLQPAWDHGLVPYFVRRCGLDLYHGTKGMLPLWSSCREVVTVHDLAVYHQPETFAWLQRVHQRSHTPFAVRHAVRVIADSEYGRQDLLDRFTLRPEQVVAIPLAAGPQFGAQPAGDDEAIAARLHLPRRYVLYAGTIQPRKNVETLVAAFATLPTPNETQLIIAGRVRPGYQPSFLQQPPAGVRYLGPVDDRELAVLYRRAVALCSPSSYEGFGLSLLEAMSSGCLVVAGRNSAVPEVVNGCGLLLDELDVPALRAALERVLRDDPWLEDLRRRGRERAAQYSWDETARRTLAVYRDATRDVRAAA